METKKKELSGNPRQKKVVFTIISKEELEKNRSTAYKYLI
jgi:hypothetical protein